MELLGVGEDRKCQRPIAMSNDVITEAKNFPAFCLEDSESAFCYNQIKDLRIQARDARDQIRGDMADFQSAIEFGIGGYFDFAENEEMFTTFTQLAIENWHGFDYVLP